MKRCVETYVTIALACLWLFTAGLIIVIYGVLL